MPAPISDEKLTDWAREHLVYEAGMLAFASGSLARQRDEPRGADTNVLLESFAIHVRCLDDFLWGERNDRYPHDAFATDFCSPEVWERQRPGRPPGLVDARKRDRAGREIVHLSYHRLDVPAATKDWPVGEITRGIIDAALGDLAEHALSERLDDRTRAALRGLPPILKTVATASSSTATQETYTGGTIPFRGFNGI